jgi:hypothetical protein
MCPAAFLHRGRSSAGAVARSLSPGSSECAPLRGLRGERGSAGRYGWLFKSRNMHKQNTRIPILLEEDAYDRILRDWRPQGYPFGHLVPPYGGAIGSSGDDRTPSPI